MTSYHIKLEGDTLKVDFNRDVPAKGDQLVRDAETRLDEMIQSGEIKGGTLLKISGPQSIPICYTIAHRVSHLYGAIAVCDPRIGHVVVISTNPAYPVGKRLDFVSQSHDKQECDNAINTTESAFLVGILHAVSQDTGRSVPGHGSAVSVQEGDTLKVGFNPQVTAEGDKIVTDTVAQLEQLYASGKLKGNLLKINGRASVLSSYVIAHKVAHLYGTIALFDPKIGDKGLDRYIVAISHGEDYRVGDTFDIEYNQKPNIKVVLCGPPNTGKTVFRDGLKQTISQLNDAPNDFFVISGCPDGDGSWFSETARNNRKSADKLKQAYKANFTPKFAQDKAEVLRAIKNSLLLFDVGGQPSSENETIMAEATHAVILAKTEADVIEWQKFCQKLNLSVIAIIYSDYEARQDSIETESPLLTGIVHHLKRGEDVSGRPVIQALANLLVNLTNS
jgi:CRISPR-associated protein Csx3